jgi:hypothetical protein
MQKRVMLMKKNLLGGEETGQYKKVEITRTTVDDQGTTRNMMSGIVDMDPNPNPGRKLIKWVTIEEALKNVPSIIVMVKTAVDHFLHTETLLSLLTTEMQRWMNTSSDEGRIGQRLQG